MIKSYCNYGIYNDNTGECLEEGANVNQLTCWNDGQRVSLENVHIVRISRDEVTCELEDYEEITILIEDICGWEGGTE